ncbi:MAG: hypothetical protein AAGI68_07460 [Planctomycetota bacterium]
MPDQTAVDGWVCVGCHQPLRLPVAPGGEESAEQESGCAGCGFSKGRFRPAPLLRYSDKAWLRSLGWSLRWMAAILLLGFLANLVVGWLYRDRQDVIQVVGLVINSCYALGVWVLTRPEPNAGAEVPAAPAWVEARVVPPASRRWARACLISAYLPLVLALGGSRWVNQPAVVVVFLLSTGVLALVSWFSTLLYLKHLASRMYDSSLIKQTGSVIAGFGIGAALILLSIAVVMVSAGGLGRGASRVLDGALVLTLLLIAALVLLIYGVWLLLLFMQYAEEFATLGGRRVGGGQSYANRPRERTNLFGD